MHSVAEENYIKAIYHAQEGDDLVSTNKIAARMNTKASSVTDMLKKLADKQLVEYIPYKGSRLTKNGLDYVMQIIRKHRLWEVFLVQKLQFSWDEVHEVAEQLEHIQSRKLINELDKLLGFPKQDPHGDPIPDRDGNLEKTSNVMLSQLSKNDEGTIAGVVDTSTAFLKYLDKHNVQLGSSIKFVDREEYDQSVIIEVDGEKLTVSQKTADHLYIKKGI